MSKISEDKEMKKVSVDALEQVAGGATQTIEVGDFQIQVEQKEEITEDDLKGSDAKKYKGALATIKKMNRNKN